MARALVTGAAGFIGSHLCTRLLDNGIAVRGLDNFDPFYPRSLKERNLEALLCRDGFEFHEIDLAEADIEPLLERVDWVFHQAARGGVRTSWGVDFPAYEHANILATQKLLEALRRRPVERIVCASSSSVYGEGGGRAVEEHAALRPISPYGVTKLAAERLVEVYHAAFGLPTVSLRYFTVYGPGQRPDMAFHRFIRALLEHRSIEVLGDGQQTRDFTFVADVVTANLLAAERGAPGRVYNIGGGSPAAILDVIHALETITNTQAVARFLPAPPGDPRATAADTTRARQELGFRPTVSLEMGLERMVAWMSDLLAAGASRARARQGSSRTWIQARVSRSGNKV